MPQGFWFRLHRLPLWARLSGFLVILSLIASPVWIGFYLSQRLIYPFSGIDHTSGRCRTWHHEKSFVTYDNPTRPVDEPCETARDRPYTSTFVTNDSGKKIHIRQFNNLPKDSNSTRGWLHIHGVTSTGLDGARYYHAANRLGFHLFSMDLSNHGLSEDDGRGASYGCREREDVVAVMKYLLKTFPNREWIITASSMGGMALINSSKALFELPEANRIKAFSIENAPTSVRAIAARARSVPPMPRVFLDIALEIAKWRMQCDFDAWQPIDQVANIKVPVWFLHSKQDEILPSEMATELAAQLPRSVTRVVSIRDRGYHSALWNENPSWFEAELASIFDTGSYAGHDGP